MISPEIAPYIVEFNYEMGKRGITFLGAPLPIVATYGHVSDGYVGVCITPYNVIILAKSVRDGPEYNRKTTIFHELVHCRGLVSRHSEDPNSIMFYRDQEGDFTDWDLKLDALADFIKQYSAIYAIQKRLETGNVWSP